MYRVKKKGNTKLQLVHEADTWIQYMYVVLILIFKALYLKATYSSEETDILSESTNCTKKGNDKDEQSHCYHHSCRVSWDTGELTVITLLSDSPEANTHHDTTNALERFHYNKHMLQRTGVLAMLRRKTRTTGWLQTCSRRQENEGEITKKYYLLSFYFYGLSQSCRWTCCLQTTKIACCL